MPWMHIEIPQWLSITSIILFHIVGALHVLHAVMNVRTSQGTIAWIMSLLAFPYLAIPLYWLLGRTRFSGYVKERRADDDRIGQLAHSMREKMHEFRAKNIRNDPFSRAAEILGGLPFTEGNSLDLLIDGKETFESLFEAINGAKSYLCINFYIVQNDRVGRRFQRALIERAKAGVKIWFLFDELGSHKLPRKYLREMRDVGIECSSFGTNRTWVSRLQLNFRNHRKLVVIDGEISFIGGINIGDEYLGRDQRYGKWRDTHLKMRGPVVQASQLVFLSDWLWATGRMPELVWETRGEKENQVAAVIPTGPADVGDSWQLLVAEAANSAEKRLWITSPYFVPDEGVMTALQTAAIRGVDVRILLPDKADHVLVWLSAFSYYEQAIPFGVKLYRYQRGFLHEKVTLIDDCLAAVGTANIDNRSLRLNFEITAYSPDPIFVKQVEAMLMEDFSHATLCRVEEFTERSFLFRAAARTARLFSPLQ